MGNLLTNISIGKVAVSFTHTIKALEPLFTVVLSSLFLGEVILLKSSFFSIFLLLFFMHFCHSSVFKYQSTFIKMLILHFSNLCYVLEVLLFKLGPLMNELRIIWLWSEQCYNKGTVLSWVSRLVRIKLFEYSHAVFNTHTCLNVLAMYNPLELFC